MKKKRGGKKASTDCKIKSREPCSIVLTQCQQLFPFDTIHTRAKRKNNERFMYSIICECNKSFHSYCKCYLRMSKIERVRRRKRARVKSTMEPLSTASHDPVSFTRAHFKMISQFDCDPTRFIA